MCILILLLYAICIIIKNNILCKNEKMRIFRVTGKEIVYS